MGTLKREKRADSAKRKKGVGWSRKTPVSGALKKKLLESERRYYKLLEDLPVGVYRSTLEGRIIEANRALAKMLGFSGRELKRTNVEDLYAERADRKRFLRNIKNVPFAYIEFKLRCKDGRIILGRDYSRAVKGPGGRIEYFDGILVDITREREAEERLNKALGQLQGANRERQKMIRKLRSSSITDDLTGLYNRRGFYMMAQHHLALAARRKTKMFLLFMDVDHLKYVNDTFGHHIGDDALIQVSDILKRTFRSSDVKGRMGGDEFAVFPIDASLAGVDVAMGRMLKNLADFNASGKRPYKINVSTGIACYDPEVPSTIEELLVRADKLMYEQKRQKLK
jgi:diguanylate cyclase (GGDEF)-like protein/PAS domain S-box-containing protein